MTLRPDNFVGSVLPLVLTLSLTLLPLHDMVASLTLTDFFIMNNTILFLLSLINIFAELIELTYDLGVTTRKYVLPAVIYVGVGITMASEYVWDSVTSMEYDLSPVYT